MAEEVEEEFSFKVDYAASNRSKCSGSQQLIPQGSLRMGPMVQSDKGDFKYPRWYKFDFFEDVWVAKNPGKLKSLTQVSGLDKLKFADQQKVKALVTTGDSSVDTKEMTEEEKALEQENAKLWELKDNVKRNVTANEIKEIFEDRGDPCKGPVFGGQEKLVSRLADAMTFGWLPTCAEAGGPSTCSDPGALIFSGGKYKCVGYVDEFTKCTFTSDDVERKKWKCPDFVDNAFLEKFKFKRHEKVMAVMEGEAEEMEEDHSPSSASSPVVKKKGIAEKPFEGLSVCFVGKLSKTLPMMEKDIKDNGGSISKQANKKCDVVVSNEVEVETCSNKKIVDANKLGIPIMNEDWVTESIKAGNKLSVQQCMKGKFYLSNQPTLSKKEEMALEKAERKRKAQEIAEKFEKEQADKKQKTDQEDLTEENFREQALTRKKIKIKGRAAVDPESGLDDVGHILDVKEDEIYAVTLNKADVTTGKNSYYILQLIQSDDKKKYWVFRKWGRMGAPQGGKKITEYNTLAQAKKEFSKTFLDKTGNDWSDRNNFEKKKGLMAMLEMDYGQDNTEAAEAAKKPYHGSLPKSTQNLMNLMFDVQAMTSALKEMEIDTEKMPLGKLSKATINKGYAALTDIQNVLKNQDDMDDDDVTLKLTGATNKFYAYIPHAFGAGKRAPLIDSDDLLKEKITMLDTLLDMEVATSLMSKGTKDSDEHPVDANYSKLKCKLTEVDNDSAEFQRIATYVKNTHGHTHTTYTLELDALWRMDREGEAERYAPWKDNSNRMMLWHGSRLTNWVGIVSQGLRIAPPEAPVTGYMFGKGAYFADMVSKSANYCFTNSAKTTGLMGLCEVAMGDMYELTAAKYMDKPPAPYLSTWGKGKFQPDPKGAFTEKNGCVIPLGKEHTSPCPATTLQYNEFIVYDVSQIRMRYLLRLTFNYKGKCGTFF